MSRMQDKQQALQKEMQEQQVKLASYIVTKIDEHKDDEDIAPLIAAKKAAESKRDSLNVQVREANEEFNKASTALENAVDKYLPEHVRL